jgi:hypothetical protein
MRQDFLFEIGIDVFAKRHVFRVTQGGIGRWLAFAFSFGSQSTTLPWVSRSGRSTVMVRTTPGFVSPFHPQ